MLLDHLFSYGCSKCKPLPADSPHAMQSIPADFRLYLRTALLAVSRLRPGGICMAGPVLSQPVALQNGCPIQPAFLLDTDLVFKI